MPSSVSHSTAFHTPAPLSAIEFPLCGAIHMPLKCGLTLIFKQDHSAPLISTQAWVRTGSILEGSLVGTGVSHLVEHMVFQGAGDRRPGELAHAVQETGGYLNAYTSFDRTVYWIETLREGMAVALGVLADLTMNARFPETEFAKEKDVIRREIDMGKDDPGRTVSQLMFSTVYREHPFREPVIGRLDLFNAVDRDTAFGYYKERYVADRMFLVIVGDMDLAEVQSAVEEKFGAIGSRSPVTTLLPKEPEQTARRDAHIEFATEMTRMDLAWRIPGLLHRDTAALEVLGTLMGNGRTSRLYREVRERLGLAHSVGAGAYTPVQGGIFYASVSCDPDKRHAAESAVLDQIHALCDQPVADADVARSRRIFLADQLSGLTTMSGQASDLGSNWQTAGNLDFTRHYLRSIDAVTPRDVQRVAQDYLTDDHLTSVSINPVGTQPKTSVSFSGGRPAEVQRHVFENGLTLLVREDRRLPLVTMHACLRGGLLVETPAVSGIGRLMARTIVKGTQSRTAEQLADLIENGGGSMGADSGGSSWSVSTGIMTPDFALGMDIWADTLLRPAFPQEEVARECARQIAALKQQEDHPSFIAYRALREAAYGDHPFAMNREGTPESLGAMDSRALNDFHTTSTLTGNAVFAVFGDVKMDQVCDAVAARFADMKSGARITEQSLPSLPPHVGRIITINKDKRQAFLVAGFPTVALNHPDRVALDLIDEACSDMASRFFERIRETHGLAYSVGASQILGMCQGLFTFHLSTAPEKLEFAQEELVKEIAVLARDGLSTAELDRARKTWIGKQAMQMQNSGGLAQTSALDELYGQGHDHSRLVLDRVRAIAQDEITAACRQYFSPDALIVRVTP